MWLLKHFPSIRYKRIIFKCVKYVAILVYTSVMYAETSASCDAFLLRLVLLHALRWCRKSGLLRVFLCFPGTFMTVEFAVLHAFGHYDFFVFVWIFEL